MLLPVLYQLYSVDSDYTNMLQRCNTSILKFMTNECRLIKGLLQLMTGIGLNKGAAVTVRLRRLEGVNIRGLSVSKSKC